MAQTQGLVKDGVEECISPAGLPVIPINRSVSEEQLCSLDEPAPGSVGCGHHKGQTYPREVKLHLWVSRAKCQWGVLDS